MPIKGYQYYRGLRDAINDHFDLQEFEMLCFDLGVDYDNLAGQIKLAKIQSLIIFLNKRNRSSELINHLKELRPSYQWITVQPTDFIQPYQGLSAFGEEDAPFFFGRNAFINRLEIGLRQQSLVTIIGPSGSGKSSVVFAGLIPHLRQQQGWLIVDFRPGSQPFYILSGKLLPLLGQEKSQKILIKDLVEQLQSGELVFSTIVQRLLANNSEADHILLVIDQFEELYTLCPNLETRQRFLDMLLAATESNQITILLTMRADFIGMAIAYRPFADILQDTTHILGPMNRNELAQAIEEPARVAGVEFETGLVSRILDDLHNEPGHLPILEFALSLLWDKQESFALTHAAYESIGEINGSLARYAENVFESLDEEQQEQAKHIFLQLVQPGAGTEDTRRQANKNEVGEENWELVQWLATRRLVVTNKLSNTEETVEVVHETLIRGWGRLRGWMDFDRRFREWQERLRAALRQWQETSQDEATLLRGPVLAEAESWLHERAGDLSVEEQGFIKKSVAAREHEQAQSLRRRNVALAISIAVAVLFGSLGLFSYNQSLDLASESTKAIANEGTAVAERGIAEAIAVSLGTSEAFAQTESTRAFENEGTAEAERIVAQVESVRASTNEQIALTKEAEARQQAELALAQALVANSQILAEKKAITNQELALARLLAVEADGLNKKNGNVQGQFLSQSQLLALAQNQPIAYAINSSLTGHASDVKSVSWSPPDMGKLASASADGTVIIWDTRTWQQVMTLDHTSGVISVSWSPDGRFLASGTNDYQLTIWDTDTWKKEVTLDHDGWINSVSWSPDGQYLASASDVIIIWDTRTWQDVATFTRHSRMVQSVSWSPDGQHIASASLDGLVFIWRSGVWEYETALDGHFNLPSWVNGVIWSPDGRQLASASDDRTVIIWDTRTWQEVTTLTSHTGKVQSVSWSADGHFLASGSQDETVIIWETETWQEEAVLSGPTSIVWNVAWALNGQQLAVAYADGTIVIWETGLRQTQTTLTVHGDWPNVAWSPDGQQLASSGFERGDDPLIIWDTTTWQPQATPETHRYGEIAWSPTGKQMAVFSRITPSLVVVWDTIQWQQAITLTNQSHNVAWSPDGLYMTSDDEDGVTTIWRSESWEEEAVLTGHTQRIVNQAWSPDGQYLASTSRDNSVIIWRTGTWQQETKFVSDGEGVQYVVWSPDGLYLSIVYEETVDIWQTQTWQQVATLDEQLGQTGAITWSPDSHFLAFISDEDVTIWQTIDWSEYVVLSGHTGEITDLDWSPDGSFLATSSRDSTIIIWDTSVWQEYITLFGHSASVLQVDWSPLGTQLVSTSCADLENFCVAGEIIVWDFPDLVEFNCRLAGRNLTWSEWQRYLPGLPYQQTCLQWETHPSVPIGM